MTATVVTHDLYSVPRLCTTGTVVCLATGPSLTAEDVAYCVGKATLIAINDAWRLAPMADVLYSSDQYWFPRHQWVPAFAGLKVGLDQFFDMPAAHQHGVITLRYTGDEGIDWTPNCLRSAKNSGGAAINLACHLGAKRIVLLGYDMAAGAKQKHFFGEHPQGLNRDHHYASWAHYLATMATALREKGVDVVNCSRQTSLTCFDRQPLEAVL